MKLKGIACLGILLSLSLTFAVKADVAITAQHQIADSQAQADGLNIITFEIALCNIGDSGISNLELRIHDPAYSMILPAEDVLSVETLSQGSGITLQWDLKSVVAAEHLPESFSLVIYGNGFDDYGDYVFIEAASGGGMSQ